jgi:hypothetical protein
MCQNQGQTIYTRNARTRTVAIKLNMPNPFFALALGLSTQAKFSPGENGGRHHFVPLLRDSIARAHAVIVRDVSPHWFRQLIGVSDCRYTQWLAGTGPRDVYPGPRGTGTPRTRTPWDGPRDLIPVDC